MRSQRSNVSPDEGENTGGAVWTAYSKKSIEELSSIGQDGAPENYKNGVDFRELLPKETVKTLHDETAYAHVYLTVRATAKWHWPGVMQAGLKSGSTARWLTATRSRSTPAASITGNMPRSAGILSREKELKVAFSTPRLEGTHSLNQIWNFIFGATANPMLGGKNIYIMDNQGTTVGP